MVTRMSAIIGVVALVLSACIAGGESPDDAVVTAESDPAESGPAESASAAPAAPAADRMSETVTVVGRGEASGSPDVVRATVGVEVSASSTERALDTASARASDVIDALRDAGVAQEDIQTQEISLREERQRPPRPETRAEEPDVASEIIATNVLEVWIRDIDEAGAVLAAVSEAAGDTARIQGVRFEVAETEALLEAARERAFEDARRKAEQYARLADRDLGQLVSISEQGSAPGPAVSRRLEAADAAAVPIEPGTQELTVQITAVWAFG